MVKTNLSFGEWAEIYGSERLTGGFQERAAHQVHIREMNGENYRVKSNWESAASQPPDEPDGA